MGYNPVSLSCAFSADPLLALSSHMIIFTPASVIYNPFEDSPTRSLFFMFLVFSNLVVSSLSLALRRPQDSA